MSFPTIPFFPLFHSQSFLFFFRFLQGHTFNFICIHRLISQLTNKEFNKQQKNYWSSEYRQGLEIIFKFQNIHFAHIHFLHSIIEVGVLYVWDDQCFTVGNQQGTESLQSREGGEEFYSTNVGRRKELSACQKCGNQNLSEQLPSQTQSYVWDTQWLTFFLQPL